MSQLVFPYRIFPLGDAAITIDFGSRIDEAINDEVINRFHHLQEHPLPGMIEATPAYSSLTIYYDVIAVRKMNSSAPTAFGWMKQQVEERLQQQQPYRQEREGRLVRIPVCYDDEFALDIHHIASIKNISVEEIIYSHVSKQYKVYMLGFLPGFGYMGEVDEKIATPRKPQPEKVQAGSVGIAGKQTGIYPLDSPGGWQIIGRTPLKLFNANREHPILLMAGDNVQFYSITKEEFESY